MSKKTEVHNIIGRTEEGRYPIGRVTLEQGKPCGLVDTYKTWDRVGIVSIQSTKRGQCEEVLNLYRNSKKQLMYECYVSGYFYPIVGRVLQLDGKANLTYMDKAYYIDINDGRVKQIRQCYKYFVVTYDKYDLTQLVYKCTDRVQAEIVTDNINARDDFGGARVLKNIPNMSKKVTVFYTKFNDSLMYDPTAISNFRQYKFNSEYASHNKEGSTK